MVSRHGDRHQIANQWLPIHWHVLLARGGYCKNSGLRGIDDRDKLRGVHHTQIRDRKGSTF